MRQTAAIVQDCSAVAEFVTVGRLEEGLVEYPTSGQGLGRYGRRIATGCGVTKIHPIVRQGRVSIGRLRWLTTDPKYHLEWMPRLLMSRLSWLQKLYWSHLGKPVSERVLFRYLIRNEVRSILELGVGNCQRMRRIARLVQPADASDKIRFVGTDEFEAADDDLPHVSLKQAHQIASSLGFRATLIPGDLQSALPRVASKLGASDLVIINGGMQPDSPSHSSIAPWLNRLAHDESAIFASEKAGDPLQPVSLDSFDLPLTRAA